MSIENETAITELDENELTEEVVSEQPELDDNQDVANPDDDSEQVDETDENEFLIKALSGEAEPEDENDKTKNMPRSVAKARRQNKRLQKELEEKERLIAELKNQQVNVPLPQVAERDYENETDEQYQFRITNEALRYQQAQQQEAQALEARKKMAEEQADLNVKAVESYSDVVDKLKFKDFDDVESRVLDGMHEQTLVTMAKYNAEATPKILLYLDNHPDIHEQIKKASLYDVNEFNRLFGKLEAKVESIEQLARQKRKQVSRAPSDKAVGGSGGASSLDAKILAAANAGNKAEYQRLKALKNK